MRLGFIFFCICFLTGFKLPVGSFATTCTKPGLIALTFDDGVTFASNRISNILKENDVTATFFIIGETVTNPLHFSILKKRHDQDYILGNHTWSHLEVSKLSNAILLKEVLTTQNGLDATSSRSLPRYFRPPYGSISQKAYNTLTSLHYKIILWNLDLKDWRRHRSKEKIWSVYLNAITKANVTKDSFILLLHEKEKTADLLPSIIQHAKSKNFKFVSLDYCLK